MIRTTRRRWSILMLVSLAILVVGAAPGAVAAPRGVSLRALVSGPTPFVPNCNGAPQTGTVYPNAEVEPFVAVNPRNPANIIGVWQQDRWSNGGAQGLGTGVSRDGGLTWQRQFVPWSRCAGGSAANNGNYERATDPWVTFAPNGDAYQISLSFNDSNPLNAILVSKSTNGGASWSRPVTLIRDGAAGFNDKESITADPNDPRYVYAVWDRLSDNGGPTYFARTTNGGRTWEPARSIYNPQDANPGGFSQTIGNQIVGLPNGDIVNLFTQFDNFASGDFAVSLAVIRSTNKGATWSIPYKINDLLSIGTRDPATGQPIRDGDIIPDIAVGGDGALYVVWQDARFSNGERDGIALAKSTDGGKTWTEPVQVNRRPDVQAFTASVHVASNGTIGVTYFDLRNDTAEPATLPTDYWLVRSRDGARTGRESRVSGPFNLKNAPVAGGLFIGDYQGLSNVGPYFLPFFVQTTDTSLRNRTDVYATFRSARRFPLPGITATPGALDAEDAPAHTFVPASTTDLSALKQQAGAHADTVLRQRNERWPARAGK